MGERQPQQVFGTVVRKFRLAKGLSQEELAEEAGLHRTYISLLERGLRNPSLTVILKVAHALRVGVAELISDFDQHSRGDG
jgi:transcriptional regulator with XRE-family HTH domain